MGDGLEEGDVKEDDEMLISFDENECLLSARGGSESENQQKKLKTL